MLTMRVTPKISDSPAATKNRPDAAASPLSAWNRRASGLIEDFFTSPRLRGEVGPRSGPGEGAGAFPRTVSLEIARAERQVEVRPSPYRTRRALGSAPSPGFRA